MTEIELARHARELRDECFHALPNGVGNTIDALCDKLEALSRERDELRQKIRMIISHASGGHLSEPGDIDRSTNDICVEISRSKNDVFAHGKEVGAKEASEALSRENAVMREAAETGLEYIIDAANECKQKDAVFDNIMRDLKRVEAALAQTQSEGE